MRGFRIIHHTEKVGEAVGSCMTVTRIGTYPGRQQGRDSGEFLLRRHWPVLDEGLRQPRL
jgi:hypothetical protein